MKSFVYSALAASMLTVLTACSGGKSDKADEENADQRPLVRVEAVHSRQVDQNGVYTATVEPEIVNNISANMSNRIKEIFVDEGMRVSKGQRLVVLDDVNITSYQLQVDNAKAALANVQRDYDRALELFNIGGGTRQSLDQMELQLTNARNTLANAERALRNVTENTVLTSPINGIVTARNYDPGDMTGALPVLTVARVQPVKIVINVTESDYSKIHTGMPATVTFDTYGSEVFDGRVSLVSPTVDPASRTFGVEVTLPNSDNRVLPGMFGRVRLNLGTAEHVVVPDRAVIKQPGSGNHYVYVYKDGQVNYRLVELGQRLGDSYEILDGLNDGDLAVVTDQSRLADGIEVQILDK
ncbi:MAG: efflux RND transporter periplasmic adaptor subunit [Muribaculaceae bacterium]|nr:efflux RND transporter periplasmic adaptor subunit [Bacteroides sp.]MDE6681106.1 efflux RND transporter periplasmic adaptor subunit [Muribaculaceae bacterium]MDE7190535.1 efflux RND transporter periplasmic adaptor subunit [Muribaculaceae bacterium]